MGGSWLARKSHPEVLQSPVAVVHPHTHTHTVGINSNRYIFLRNKFDLFHRVSRAPARARRPKSVPADAASVELIAFPCVLQGVEECVCVCERVLLP